ncbi:hypothetical protein, partial [Dysosmobacter sp.]|uniref:hypothetical protein n=1 Tax=Dysosmobacter sp. TaxID=2591382 RepID=UPI002A9C6F6F
SALHKDAAFSSPRNAASLPWDQAEMGVLTDEHTIADEMLCRKPPRGIFFHLLPLGAACEKISTHF